MGVRPDRADHVVRVIAISGAASELQVRAEGAARRQGELDQRSVHKARDIEASARTRVELGELVLVLFRRRRVDHRRALPLPLGCCLARGFGADRRGNALILLDCEGSTKCALE